MMSYDKTNMLRSLKVDFIFWFNFSFSFYFYFYIFIFLEQLGLGLEVISHTITSVTIWWYGHNFDYKT